jgi:hypothetical protein
MAGVIAHVNSGECTLVASTAKSLLQIKAATNQRVLIRGLKIMGKQPAGGTDTPVKIRLTRSTANFGTFTSATPSKNDPSDGETLQTTCGSNATVEPTSPTDGGLWWEVQPQSGIIEFEPPDLVIKVPGGQSVQFEATSAASNTPVVLVTATFEE